MYIFISNVCICILLMNNVWWSTVSMSYGIDKLQDLDTRPLYRDVFARRVRSGISNIKNDLTFNIL